MAPKPKDVKRKLDDLYWKTDEIRKELISLHGMLTEMNFFEEYQAPPLAAPPVQPPPQTYMPPPPQYVAPPPPVMPPPVMPPPVYQQPKPQPVPVQQFSPPPQQQTMQPPPPKQPSKTFFERNPDLEKFIGERLVTFIGIAVLVTGIAFFVKYAIDKNWINEIGRTAIGILSGGILLGFAHRLRKSFTAFSSVLVGGGISVLYFTISYAFQVYHLFPQAVAFGILVVITGFTVLLSVAYDRKELAILAIVGGFTTPLMVATDQGNFNVLCTYILILDAGMLALAWFKKWNLVNIVSYAFTILLFTGALLSDISKLEHPHYVPALIFSTLLYLTFFLMNIVNNVKNRTHFKALEIIILLSNSFLYYGCGYFVLYKMEAQVYQGLFTLLVGIFNFGFAFALFRRQEVDKLLVYFLIGLVITFVSLAGPVQLEGNHITLFWAAESVLLLWLWQRSEVPLIRLASMLINIAMLLSLGLNWLTVYRINPEADSTLVIDVLLNKAFVTGICVAIALGLSSFLLTREKNETIAENWTVSSYRMLVNTIAVIILYFTGLFELLYQLGAHESIAAAKAIYVSGYTSLFVLVAWIVSPWVKMNYMRNALSVLSVLLFLVCGMAMHYFTMRLRDHCLVYQPGDNRAYLFHYMNIAAVLALAVLVGLNMLRNVKIEPQLRSVYLWLVSVVFVFIVSTEIDNSVVMAGFDTTIDIGSNPVAGIQEIAHLATQSQKIGYPIAWGIISFIMIVIGMRRKIRQLRIIALALFTGTLIKLILLGIYGESQAGKIVAFILSGVILLLVSFLYQKLKKMILEDEPSNEKTTGNE